MRQAANFTRIGTSGAASGRRPNAPKSSRAPSAMCSATLSSSALDGSAGHPFRLAGTRVCALVRPRAQKRAVHRALGGGEPADDRRPRDHSRQRTGRHGRRRYGAERRRRADRSRTPAPAAHLDRGRASPAPSASWRRSKCRNGSARARSARLLSGRAAISAPRSKRASCRALWRRAGAVYRSRRRPRLERPKRVMAAASTLSAACPANEALTPHA